MRYLIVVLILVLLAASTSCAVFADLWISFWSTHDGGKYSFFIMNPDGSDPRNLTRELGLEELRATAGRRSPPEITWSPDRRKILFSSGPNHEHEIVTV